MEDLINSIQEAIDSEYKSYEMGCLISSEFTPAPDWGSVRRVIQESGYSFEEIEEYLKQKADEEFASIVDKENLNISDTSSGYLLCTLTMIIND